MSPLMVTLVCLSHGAWAQNGNTGNGNGIKGNGNGNGVIASSKVILQ